MVCEALLSVLIMIMMDSSYTAQITFTRSKSSLQHRPDITTMVDLGIKHQSTYLLCAPPHTVHADLYPDVHMLCAREWFT